MKKLENKIIRKVYFLETKNILTKLTVFILLTVAGFFIGLMIYAQLTEQKTWDMLQIFQEDVSIIREYLGEVMYNIFQETPKIPLFFFILSTVFIVVFLIFLVKNWKRLKSKAQSIIKFWLHI